MKKLIFLELALLFLATTFSSSPPPPGWYQQTLPVSDQINDIFFLDSLNGWAVTDYQGGTGDTSYILRTTNGGNNWEINYRTFVQFTAIQFANSEVGYACGISSGPELFKSTNGGINWNTLNVLTFTWKSDLSFINEDTGWVCSDDPFDGGVFKTTNGGQGWIRQLNYTTDNPHNIFFINENIGWIGTVGGHLYKTYDGGLNWNLQYNIGSKDIIFVNSDTGWIASHNSNKISFTSNGGNNWIIQNLPPKDSLILNSRPSKISSVDGKVVYCVGGNVFFGMGRVRGIIFKSANSGTNWIYQIPDTSINIPDYSNIQFVNDSLGWAAYTGMIHTTDGGGPLVNVSNINSVFSKSFTLAQNYPNPFNPVTNLEFGISKLELVSLKVYNMLGKEVATIADSRFNPGIYKYEFDGRNLNSGVYFYRLEVRNEKTNEVFSETKKMLLVK